MEDNHKFKKFEYYLCGIAKFLFALFWQTWVD